MQPSTSAWVLTDGKAGDEGQCLAVVEALGLTPEIRRVAPRRPWAWLLPRGPLDPAERPGRPGSPLRPPWPDLLVGSGRRAVGYLPAIKAASAGRTFTVCLKDPRVGAGIADLVWAPSYDRLRGRNVVRTLTSPHRLSASGLAALRSEPDERLAALPAPRAAVLVGGDSRHGRFTSADGERLVGDLRRLAGRASLMITASRRTPEPIRAALAALAVETGAFLWDGRPPNPFAGMLALADTVVATADSINMMSEAVATGRPVLLFRPARLARRHAGLADALTALGAAHPFTGVLAGSKYEPIDSTPVIAAAMASALEAHRARLGGR